MYLTIQGLVLRVSNYSDTDAIITLLTKDQGKLTVKARGLRRKNSPLIASCQLLAFAEFTLFEHRGFYTINEANTIELFHTLRKDLTRFSLGTYFAQVAEVLSQEDLPNPELLSLLLNCLHALSKLDLPEEQVKAVFELRSACLSGYMPDLTACECCENLTPDRLDISRGMVSCSTCANTDESGIRMPLSEGILNAMRYITQCHPKRLFAFSLNEEAYEDLSHITEAYLCAQLERGFSVLDFYKTLKSPL